jgi:hypothetical protein
MGGRGRKIVVQGWIWAKTEDLMQKITKAIVKSTVLIKKKIVINELYLL